MARRQVFQIQHHGCLDSTLFVTLIMSSEYLPIGTKETVVLPHIHGIFPTHFNRNGT